MAHKLNLVTLTATQAQGMLEKGTITSVELIEAYLYHIDQHNHKGLCLNALISVAPRALALEAARKLDDERRAGNLRGPLHGIPIVLKDMFLTSTTTLGLPTTLGSPCFASATCKHNSPLVQHLVDSGLIILGKANMTELCGLKMRPNTPGWSPQGGQTQNPYIFGGLEKDEKLIGNSSPGGSSSGSGAAVAAGFAPLALGSQTGGSVILPSNRHAVYALTCGHGTVNTDGNYQLSEDIDSVGAMAKTAADARLLASLIMGRSSAFDVQGEFGFSGMKVGFLDPEVWHTDESMCSFPGDTNEQIKNAYRIAIDAMEKAGAATHVNVDLAKADFTTDGEKSLMYEVSMQQLRSRHLSEFMAQFDSSEVRSLEEMVAWNDAHADVTMPPDHPSQEEFTDLLKNTTTDGECQAMLVKLRKQGRDALDRVFESVDVLVALADSTLCSYASAAGYPTACVPLSSIQYSETNARPFGLCLTAPRRKEDLLLRFMHAFELVSPPRPLPRPLLQCTGPVA